MPPSRERSTTLDCAPIETHPISTFGSRNSRARWPDCGERSLGCVPWALKSSLAAKAEQVPGQSLLLGALNPRLQPAGSVDRGKAHAPAPTREAADDADGAAVFGAAICSLQCKHELVGANRCDF
jgi:hypothetical protein